MQIASASTDTMDPQVTHETIQTSILDELDGPLGGSINSPGPKDRAHLTVLDTLITLMRPTQQWVMPDFY